MPRNKTKSQRLKPLNVSTHDDGSISMWSNDHNYFIIMTLPQLRGLLAEIDRKRPEWKLSTYVDTTNRPAGPGRGRGGKVR